MNTRQKLGQRITYLRHEAKQTEKALAEKANITPEYLSKLERGLSNPSLDILSRISSALDLPLSTLLAGVDSEADLYHQEENQDPGTQFFLSLQEQIFYPAVFYPPVFSEFVAYTPYEVFAYLPLLAPEILGDILCRLSGLRAGNESYFLEIFNDFIKQIPPSPALNYANYMVAWSRNPRHRFEKLPLKKHLEEQRAYVARLENLKKQLSVSSALSSLLQTC